MRLLVLDNFDSFTYTLVDYLQQVGADCVVKRNDQPLGTFTADAYAGVVLSPGPGTPTEAGCLPDVVRYYYNRLPMLGVCLGQQAIGQFFGATLTKSPRPMHGKVSNIRIDSSDALFENLPARLYVTRYHSLTLVDLPPTLEPIATTDTGEVMAIRHRSLPVWGIQFHPEAALTEGGLTILRNFTTTVKSTTL
jgi:anthranilate synthase/aminodeoxychorismate synthase-like glutamine amidotransferase